MINSLHFLGTYVIEGDRATGTLPDSGILDDHGYLVPLNVPQFVQQVEGDVELINHARTPEAL